MQKLSFYNAITKILRVVINVLTDVKRQKRINKLQY